MWWLGHCLVGHCVVGHCVVGHRVVGYCVVGARCGGYAVVVNVPNRAPQASNVVFLVPSFRSLRMERLGL